MRATTPNIILCLVVELGLAATLRAEGVPEARIKEEAAKTQENVDRLGGEVDVILDYPRTVRDIERLLSYIRATP